MHSLISTIYFILMSGILFLLPGLVILRSFFNKQSFVPFETLLFSFGISLGLIDFLMIIIGKLGIRIGVYSLSVGIIAALAILAIVAFTLKRERRLFRQRVNTPIL